MKFVAARLKKWIYVPAITDGDKVVVPQAWLGADVKHRKIRGNSFSAAEYQKLNPPTLAESRHAFFDTNPGGYFISPEYRQSVCSAKGYGEWTSTFLRDGKECIERPERVFYDKKRGLWMIEGGKVSRVELPPNGFVLEYDKPTGFPSRTSQHREDAEKVFGDDTSYSWLNENGLRVALRGFDLRDGGPFYVHADFGPGKKSSSIGTRSCRKS